MRLLLLILLTLALGQAAQAQGQLSDTPRWDVASQDTLTDHDVVGSESWCGVIRIPEPPVRTAILLHYCELAQVGEVRACPRVWLWTDYWREPASAPSSPRDPPR